jgi:16S rRNA (guanine966-N2)-methyltransferase
VPVSARPTSARAREALFDILAPRLPGARILDLFAGSGAVGLEAVSRGAASAVLVEASPLELRRNLARLGDPPAVRCLGVSSAEAIRSLARGGERFDIVFADPPYGQELTSMAELAALAALAPLVAPGGTLVVQVDAGAAPPDVARFRLATIREYGRNRFAFYTPAEGFDVAGGAPAR